MSSTLDCLVPGYNLLLGSSGTVFFTGSIMGNSSSSYAHLLGGWNNAHNNNNNNHGPCGNGNGGSHGNGYGGGGGGDGGGYGGYGGYADHEAT